jgi:hypothetical protein
MTVENHQTVQPWLTNSGSQVIPIHRDMPIDHDEVVNIFSTKHPRIGAWQCFGLPVWLMKHHIHIT